MLAQLSSAPVHSASLVDPSFHNPATLQLIKVDLSRNFIEYIVDAVVDTVDYALGRPTSSSRGRSLSRRPEHVKFSNFVADVIHKAEVKLPSLLVTLVYINRAKPHLQIALEQWACERVFLGALIVANKYLNDSTLKNVHWALCTGVFGKRDIGRIEREFLDVLDFELGVSEADILVHHSAIMSFSHPSHHIRARTLSSDARVRPESPSHSRWSSDSDEMDLDSDSLSSDSISLPSTPEDVVSYAPALGKPALLGSGSAPVPQYVVLPTPPQVHTAHAHAQPAAYDRADAYIPPAAPSQPQQKPRQRKSTALQLLHSFPIPHFNSKPAAAQPSAPSSSSFARNSSTSCRPLPHPALAVPSAAYAPQVIV
ncbi:uncharacterized protein FIBRA_00773 [Fibroporia radiculosa]|uniref:Cyclin N-terminal domain-containing protein n=1 Tax=Fibroporia radiculosa TaxID=599839 RepID=J4G0L4_9APHY|nr:uncharacterized protein FIBRA_00773 [Fibroporia radiculosa]CCL98768.1 predicted protein [Fibroporia radiculosa]